MEVFSYTLAWLKQTLAKCNSLTEEEKRRKELVKKLLRTMPLQNGQDLNNIMKEFIAEMVSGSLEGEPDDELGIVSLHNNMRRKNDIVFTYGAIQKHHAIKSVLIPFL